MDNKNTRTPHNPKSSGQTGCRKVLPITRINLVQAGSGRNRKRGIDVRFSSVGYLQAKMEKFS